MTTMNRQSGAALVVGMIVLLIMTLLGITSMSTSTTELKMANNLQSFNTGFQAASSILQHAMIDPDVVGNPDPSIDFGNVTTVQPVQNFDNNVLTNAAATASVAYVDCKRVVKGYSLRNQMRGLVHEVTATGTAINTGGVVIATSNQVLGIQTVSPGCP